MVKRRAAREAKEAAKSIFWEGTELTEKSEPIEEEMMDDYEERVHPFPLNISIDEKTNDRFQEESIISIESVQSEVKSEVCFEDVNVAPAAGVCLWAQPYDSLIHGPCKIELILATDKSGIFLKAVYDTDAYR
jgi:hypothetical protein